MTTSMVNAKKLMKRTVSKKSHSWWWDSHISPKNSKWLAENLEEMDQSVKRMLKLIEEDGDSFAKKAEMYYQKRPELISQVEEFYRVYRSLAERYDHVTGELRKNIPSDLQSQGSGISEVGSDPGSTWPSPDERPSRRKSGHRAAGFDVFLGSGGSHSDLYNKDGDEMSSSLDSESESDDSSSVNNYSSSQVNAGDPEWRRKIIELEMELRDTKEKLRNQEIENANGSSGGAKNGNSEEVLTRIAGYEEELRAANEKIWHTNEEISRLRMKLQKYGSLEFTNGSQAELESVEKDVKTREVEMKLEAKQGLNIQETVEVPESDDKVLALVEELRMTKESLKDSEKEINTLRHEFESNKSESLRHLQEQLELAQRDTAMWKVKLNAEKREVSKLQERIARYKTNLSDREQEIRELKVAVSDAEQSFSLENLQLKAKVSNLIEEQTRLEEMLEEWKQKSQNLAEEITTVKAEKAELECLREAKEKSLNCEIEQLKADIIERGDHMDDMNKSLDALKLKHDMLISERDELNVNVATLLAEMGSKDDRIGQMEKHWHQLHMEQAELIVGIKKAHKLVEELSSRVNELEKEVETQRVVIIGAAEEKREAIRQLCFSIEHYRNGYHQLRQAFNGHKRPAILAS